MSLLSIHEGMGVLEYEFGNFESKSLGRFIASFITGVPELHCTPLDVTVDE